MSSSIVVMVGMVVLVVEKVLLEETAVERSSSRFTMISTKDEPPGWGVVVD